MEFDELEDGSTQAVVYWYTYDSQGNPIFMLGNGVADGLALQIEFESPYGMKYGEFDPDSVVQAKWRCTPGSIFRTPRTRPSAIPHRISQIRRGATSRR